MKISKTQQRKQFLEKGYFIGKINSKIVKQLRKNFLSFFNSASELSNGQKIKNDSDLMKLYNSQKRFVWTAAFDLRMSDPLLLKLATSKEIINLAKIAGIKKPYFKTMPIYRVDMPKDDPKYSFGAHQDYPYSEGSKNSITMWLPLQNINVKNGALKVAEGTHKSGKIYKRDKKNIILKKYKFNFKSILCKPGDVIVFSQNLVHKSGYNSSNTVRFSVGFRFSDLSKKDSISTLLMEKYKAQKTNFDFQNQ